MCGRPPCGTAVTAGTDVTAGAAGTAELARMARGIGSRLLAVLLGLPIFLCKPCWQGTWSLRHRAHGSSTPTDNRTGAVDAAVVVEVVEVVEVAVEVMLPLVC